MSATAAIVTATFLGPVFAVLVTRFIDWKRDKAARRYRIFSTLMSMRGRYLEFEYVRALNLVQVEFHDRPAVLTALRELFAALDVPNVQFGVVREKVDSLVYEIAKVVGLSARPVDLSTQAWVPNRWVYRDVAQQAAEEFVSGLATGAKALPVQVVAQEPPAQPGGTSGGTKPEASS